MPVPAVPAGAGAVPEEDRPEHHRGIGHAVITGAVGVVTGPVDGGQHHHQQDGDDRQHSDAAGPAGLGVGAVGAALRVAQAEVLLINLVQRLVEGQDRPVVQVAGQNVLQVGDHPVGQDRGEIVAGDDEIVLVLDRNCQNSIPLAQAHVQSLVPGKGLGVGDLGVCRDQGHHALIAVIPVGVIKMNPLFRVGGQNAAIVPEELFNALCGQAFVQVIV